MGSTFDPADVAVWTVNVSDPAETVREWGADAGVTLPMLYDGRPHYERYYAVPAVDEPYAPYPLWVVVDREGVITYISHQLDQTALEAAVEAAL